MKLPHEATLQKRVGLRTLPAVPLVGRVLIVLGWLSWLIQPAGAENREGGTWGAGNTNVNSVLGKMSGGLPASTYTGTPPPTPSEDPWPRLAEEQRNYTERVGWTNADPDDPREEAACHVFAESG